MTSKRADQPAHPRTIQFVTTRQPPHSQSFPGMTLREHAAIQIASGLCADPQFMGEIAPNAVCLADALMAELEKPQ